MIHELPNLPPVNPPDDPGHIKCTGTDWNPEERRYAKIVWEWVGGNVVLLDREFLLDDPNATMIGDGTLRLGPYILELLGTSWGTDSYVAVRKP